MKVTRVRRYPVKSFAGFDVGSALVEPWGLAGDRRWAVVEPDGTPITAREANGLLGLTAEPLADGGLLLGVSDRADAAGGAGGAGGARRAGGVEPLRVDVPADAEPVPVGHSRQVSASPAGAEADEWITARIGRAARLVWQSDPRARAVNPSHGGRPGDHVSLADVAPLLLTSEASLARLDEWTDAATPPLDMLRFRPNVVIDGDEPFAEEAWSHVALGGIRFRVNGVCDRCVMTTIDPTSLTRGKEPIRTLARHHAWGGKTWFGVWLVPDLEASTTDEIRVGDPVAPSHPLSLP